MELYYAYQDALRNEGPEERNNEYKKIYAAWHPQSYQCRHFRALGISSPNLEHGSEQDSITVSDGIIIIREEEYEDPTVDEPDSGSNKIIDIVLPQRPDRIHWRALRVEVEQVEANVNFEEDFVVETKSQPYFTKEAIDKAMLVRELQAKLGMFSLRNIAEAQIGEALINKECWSRSQILTIGKILGTDIAYKMGVHTAKKQFRGTQDEHDEDSLVIEAGIIVDENLIMLICVAIPTLWTTIIQIKDRPRKR